VNITITPVNDAPVAVDDTGSVAEGGTLNVPEPGLLSNDTDADLPGDTLTVYYPMTQMLICLEIL